MGTTAADWNVGGALNVTGLTTLSGGIALTGAFTFTGTNFNLDPTGTYTLDMDAGQAYSVDILGAASNITLASTGAGHDLTVNVTGATDSSLVLSSTGTAADALQVAASAGGVDISAALGLDLVSADAACGWTHTASGGAEDLTIAVAGAVDSSLVLSSAGTGTDALQIAASAGGLVITSANQTSSWTHTADGAADDLTIAVAGATDSSLFLSSAGTGTDAIAMTASAGGIDITAATSLDLVSADTACGWTHTASGAAEDLSIAVAGAVDSSLILSSAGTGADALQVTASAGGIVMSSANTTSSWTHAADGAGDDLTISVTGAVDSSLILQSAGTGADAVTLQSAGGVLIGAGGAVSVLSTDPMTFSLGALEALQFDNAAISGFDLGTDTAGTDVYVETADAGATPTVARAGGAYNFKTGDGAAAADATACGAGGALDHVTGAGGANTGGASGEAGGDGGAYSITTGAGGATNSQGAHNAGDAGDVTITAGDGGNATAGTGDGGNGGGVTITAGAGGTTTGGAAGSDGLISLAGTTQIYRAGSASAALLRAYGPASGEGMDTMIVDITVSPAAVETAVFSVPAGAVIRAVLGNCESALTGGGTTVTWSLGTAADPDKYGSAGLYPTQADSLAQNSKSNWIIGGTQLTGQEDIVLTGAVTGGAADGDTALTVGSVRVVIIYDTYNALANA